MHGFIDSFPVPLHLPLAPARVSAPSTTKGASNKGKEREGPSVVLYDVVKSWTAQEADDVERKLGMAGLLGYSTVVLTLSLPVHFNPALLTFPTPLFPALDPRTAPPGTSGLILQLWKVQIVNYDDEAVKGAAIKGIYGFTSPVATLYPPAVSVLGACPTSLAAFSHSCLSLSAASPFTPSILTFDPSQSARLLFPFKRGPVNTAQRAGLQFEILYAGLTQQDAPGALGSSSGVRRRNWIAGAREIVRATGGVGIILSSGATRAGEMRSSEDLINLCTLIGLTSAQAKDALTVNPQRAIVRGLSTKQSYKGVISNPTLSTTAILAPETLKRKAAEAISPQMRVRKRLQ